MKVSEREFEDWKQHPVTEWYIKGLEAELHHNRIMTGSGGCISDTAEEMAMKYSSRLGYQAGINFALTIEPDGEVG